MSTKKHASNHHRGAALVPPSRARKQFETIAAKLRAETDLADAWRQARYRATALVLDELNPLRVAHDQSLKRLVLLLDRQRDAADLDDVEEAQLSDFIEEVLDDLRENGDDPELESLYQRYCMADDGLDEEEIKELVHEILGVDIGDVDLQTPEGMAHLRDLIGQGKAEQAAEAEPAATVHTTLEGAMETLAQRMRETAEKIARELGPAASTGDGTHPDDGRFRDELMQRADKARIAGNLVDLLSVRLELEQAHLASHLPEKQLAECNALLKEALQHAQAENAWYVREMALMVPDSVPLRPTPEYLLSAVQGDIDELKELVAGVENDLRSLQDPKHLRRWLQQLDEENA